MGHTLFAHFDILGASRFQNQSQMLSRNILKRKMCVLYKSLVKQRLGAYPARVVRVHGRRLAVSVTDLASVTSKRVRVCSARHLLALARGTIGC